ncbi:MAG TPA: ABC transporter substrate-binding protein [Candidatus Levybacteria bacterium]|nr:ABC transporter substrate-binding protein [Candidatus Levybacteria bacterium]
MVLVRRRYYTWLFKAYIKKWKKTIFSSIFVGACVFFLSLLVLNYYVFPIFNNSVVKIGYAGSYTLTTLPPAVLENVSYGLTAVQPNSEVIPAAASSWKISKNGRVYTFVLRDNLKLSNGKKFTAEDIPYKFKDVEKKIIGTNKIQFTLKNAYAPFLSVASSPIIIKNYGLHEYHIAKIEENSGFIKSLTLTNRNSTKKKIFYFYPTADALTTAFMLGEISKMENVLPEAAPEKNFSAWENVNVYKNTDYTQLVGIFFNTSDNVLSNKKIRQALTYVLPKTFPEGERTFSFIQPNSIYYTKSPNEGILDLALSRSLLSASEVKNPTITLKTPDELKPIALLIANEWKKIGVKTDIVTTNDLPTTYQALLYTMRLPHDPDMYTIWHSGQVNNITHYKNVRIDKLLEDGRQVTDKDKRIQIYADVQKYLLDDAPAAFLYFPYSYTVSR